MIFTEISDHLRAGRKVQRQAWSPDDHLQLSGGSLRVLKVKTFQGSIISTYQYTATAEDRNATDWSVASTKGTLQ